MLCTVQIVELYLFHSRVLQVRARPLIADVIISMKDNEVLRESPFIDSDRELMERLNPRFSACSSKGHVHNTSFGYLLLSYSLKLTLEFESFCFVIEFVSGMEYSPPHVRYVKII